MGPERATEIARLIALAAARRSSERDIFEALRARKVTIDELREVAELVPQLALMPAWVNGHNALYSFERAGIEPELSFSLRFAEDIAKAAAAAARVKQSPAARPCEPTSTKSPRRPR